MRGRVCAVIVALSVPLAACGTHDSLDMGGATAATPTPAPSPENSPSPSPSPTASPTGGTGTPGTEVEPNDTLPQANGLGSGPLMVDFSGTCGTTDAHDWFSFDSPNGQVSLAFKAHWDSSGSQKLTVTIHAGVTTSGGLSMGFAPGDGTSTLTINAGTGGPYSIELSCPADATVSYSATLQSQ